MSYARLSEKAKYWVSRIRLANPWYRLRLQEQMLIDAWRLVGEAEHAEPDAS